MASYFGRRDFGDPRHNFGRPVPPLSIPAQFPGQTSWPSLREGSELVAPGIMEGKNVGAKNLGSNARRRPGSARMHHANSPPKASLLATAVASHAPSTASSKQRSHVPLSSPQRSPSPAASSQRQPKSTTTLSLSESSERQLQRMRIGRTPRSQKSHSAGVEELMKLGFPRAVAEAAFRKLIGEVDARSLQQHQPSQEIERDADEYEEEVR